LFIDVDEGSFGFAAVQSGQDDGAKKDLLKALEFSPQGDDPAIRKALRELDVEEGRKARARKGLFNGLFGDAGGDEEDGAAAGGAAARGHLGSVGGNSSAKEVGGDKGGEGGGNTRRRGGGGADGGDARGVHVGKIDDAEEAAAQSRIDDVNDARLVDSSREGETSTLPPHQRELARGRGGGGGSVGGGGGGSFRARLGRFLGFPGIA